MDVFLKKLKGIFTPPCNKEQEEGYNRNAVTNMYKPLKILVLCVMLHVLTLLLMSLFFPDLLAPPDFVSGLAVIHTVFLIFTFCTLMVAIRQRRYFIDKPNTYIIFCNTYAIGCYIWASLVSAHMGDWNNALTPFIYVSICLSLVSMFRPITALLVYGLGFTLYPIFVNILGTHPPLWNHLNVLLASLLGMGFSIAMYHYRVDQYLKTQVIKRQNEEISTINRELQELVYKDTLTGIYNRRFFDEMLPDELARVSRESMVAVMMLDIDFFKLYNDHYGHEQGDVCLRRVAGLIEQSLEIEESYCIRYGGEEFFLLAAVPTWPDAHRLAENVRNGIEQARIEHQNYSYGSVTVSLGLSIAAQGSEPTLKALTREADKALYAAKHKGRNRVECAGPYLSLPSA